MTYDLGGHASAWCWSSDGAVIAVAHRDGTVDILAADGSGRASLGSVGPVQPGMSQLLSVAFSPDEGLLAVGGGHTIRMLELG